MFETKIIPRDLKIQLEQLGFKGMAKKLDGAKRLALAYAKFGFVSQKKIDEFNERLRKETLQEDKNAYSYKRLMFTDIAHYSKVPPPHVLSRLEEAINENCFDSFEVATIQWIKEIKDPIVFGRIEGCDDRFFIAQWDDDVSIEEILGI